MITPENKDSERQQLEEDMRRPMIGVRVHLSDPDDEPDIIAEIVNDTNQTEQTDQLILSSGTVIRKRYTGTASAQITEAPDILSDGITATNSDTSLNNPRRFDSKPKRLMRSSAIVVLGAGLVAACASFLPDAEGQETLPPLPRDTSATTTIAETTTTIKSIAIKCAASDLAQTENIGQLVVERGQNLTLIADACGVTIAELMEWNALTDANNINAGQILIVTPPTTTTTTTTTTTLPAPVETVPADTIPTETAPPVTEAIAPAEPTPTTIQKPRETYLSAQECANLGGTLVPVPADGRGTWKFLMSEFGLTDYQTGTVDNTDIPERFHLLEITASPNPIECKPPLSVIQAAAPVATPPNAPTTAVAG